MLFRARTVTFRTVVVTDKVMFQQRGQSRSHGCHGSQGGGDGGATKDGGHIAIPRAGAWSGSLPKLDLHRAFVLFSGPYLLFFCFRGSIVSFYLVVVILPSRGCMLGFCRPLRSRGVAC